MYYVECRYTTVYNLKHNNTKQIQDEGKLNYMFGLTLLYLYSTNYRYYSVLLNTTILLLILYIVTTCRILDVESLLDLQ